MDEVGVFEAIHSVRQFTAYRSDPVPREAILRVIEAATKAPSGGNRQPWEFIIIDDPNVVRQLGELYRDSWMEGFGTTPGQHETEDARIPERAPAIRQARRLAQNMASVPALILVCADHSRSLTPHPTGAPAERETEATSILMACQNIFLAARALGLGTRYTSPALRRERQLRALLAIPQYIEPMCLIPIGYPRGNFGPTSRRPLAEVVSINKFGSRIDAPATR